MHTGKFKPSGLLTVRFTFRPTSPSAVALEEEEEECNEACLEPGATTATPPVASSINTVEEISSQELVSRSALHEQNTNMWQPHMNLAILDVGAPSCTVLGYLNCQM